MLKSYLRHRSAAPILLLLCSGVFGAVFALYHLPLEAAAYPAGLCLLLVAAFTLRDYLRYRKKHQILRKAAELPENLLSTLEKYPEPLDQDYIAIIRALLLREQAMEGQSRERYQDMLDYYTTWAHQIKTPIAAMALHLQTQDSALSRSLREELQRIEQYVEMVLCYLRLGSSSTDYVFREYRLDGIIKGAVRRFAGQFISRGLALRYAGTDKTVVTDEKWLTFVLEQVLSNALKYTLSGEISIYLEEPTVLCVRDTGMGIAPSDLPRIFEKGYTGVNGRSEKRSSGLGLYLCAEICRRLGIGLSAESVPGEGTTIRMDLSQNPLRPE